MSSSSRENTGEQDEALEEPQEPQEAGEGTTKDLKDNKAPEGANEEGNEEGKSSEGEDNDGENNDGVADPNAPEPQASMQSSYPYYYPQHQYPPPTIPPTGSYPPVYPTHQQPPYPEPTPPARADSSASKSPADGRRNRGGVTEPFPEKLHRMLEACEKEGLVDVVSFFSHGRAFAIHKPRRFVAEVMPRFFRQTKLTSFQRQLNLYGFQRISQGADNGGYWHDLFLKGHTSLVANMKRIKIKGSDKSRSDPDTEPNFYKYPPLKGAQPPVPAAPAPSYPSMPAFGYPPPMYPPYGYPYMVYPNAPSPFQQPPASAEKKGSPQGSASEGTPAQQPGPSHPPPGFASPYGYPPPYAYMPAFPHQQHPPPYAMPPAPQPSNRNHMVQTSPVQVSSAKGVARLKPSAPDTKESEASQEEDTSFDVADVNPTPV